MLQGKQAFQTVLMGPYSNSPWHYIVIQSKKKKTTQGKLLAPAAAGSKEQLVLKSFLHFLGGKQVDLKSITMLAM